MTLATRPSPCGSKWQPMAEQVAAAAISTPQHNTTARRRSLMVLVTDIMTKPLLAARVRNFPPIENGAIKSRSGIARLPNLRGHSALRKYALKIRFWKCVAFNRSTNLKPQHACR
jgi:hypothetical protein